MNKNSINKQTYTKMNKKSLFVLGFSAALLAGCSSDNVVPNGGDGDLSGDAYVSISLHLPTTSGLRATVDPSAGDKYNDDYNIGQEAEYQVNNIRILFFDENKQFVDSKTISAETWNNSSDPGITTERTLPVQRVDPKAAYVLVMLNTPDKVTIPSSGTFDAFNNKVLVDTSADAFIGGDAKNSFFMTNSPLGVANVIEDNKGLYDGLVKVNPQRTEDDAKKPDHIANVYVERAVAKVDIEGAANDVSWSKDDDNGTYTYTIHSSADIPESREGDQVTFTQWDLDVTNKKTYAVRKFDIVEWSKDDYKNGRVVSRFFSNTLYGNKQRTYWAEDPNYSGTNVTLNEATGNVSKSNDNFYYLTDMTKAQNMMAADYCLENTFDVKNMKQGETTRIVFKATYKPHGAEFVQGVTWYLIGNSNTPFTFGALKTAIMNASSTITDVKQFEEGGVFNIESLKVKHAGDADFVQINDATEIKNIKDALGATITTYKDGVCYYVARIQHFGEDLTKWDGEDYTTGTDVLLHKYLGRYGVVRNNWYRMTLNTVFGPGTPTIPEIPDTPDDEQNYYLQTTVKIMDWAVRKQKLDF